MLASAERAAAGRHRGGPESISVCDYALRQMVERALSIVRLGVHKKTGERGGRSSRSATSNRMLQRELATLRIKRRGGHINVIDLKGAYEDTPIFTSRSSCPAANSSSTLSETVRTRKGAARLREVACALKFLHEHGITHGDLKPRTWF